MGLRITGRMCHGNLQAVFQLVFSQLILRIEAMPFKDGLHGQKRNVIVVFKFLRQLFEGWEPQSRASGKTISSANIKVAGYGIKPAGVYFWRDSIEY